MRHWLSVFFVGTLVAQQANYIILLETSQYTCGKPTQTAKQVLSDLLCSGSYGRVAIGTFYRKGERGYIDWKTTPVLEGGGTPCISTLKTIKPRCDSIYMVHLLGALETALEGGYVRAPEIILLASGMDATPGLKDTDILRLAQSKNVRIHALSIGYLANDERAQALLKRLSGQYGEGPSRGLYQIADPQSPTYQNIISNFLSSCLSQAMSGPTLEGGPSGSTVNYPPIPAVEGTSKSSKPNYTLWILIGAGALVLVGLIISLTARKPASPPPAPAPIRIQSV